MDKPPSSGSLTVVPTATTADWPPGPLRAAGGDGEVWPLRFLDRRGDTQLALHLEDQRLGPIRVELRGDGTQIDVGLRAGRPATVELLGAHLGELIDGLRERRIDVGQASVSAWQQASVGHEDARQRPGGHRGGSRDAPERPDAVEPVAGVTVAGGAPVAVVRSALDGGPAGGRLNIMA
ncbi:MAG TPA: flagellar hook-length control protein FliK [Bacillota bacterium]